MSIAAATKPSPSRREKFRVVLVALFGSLCILTLVVFFAARLAVPGDGTQVIFPQSGSVAEGLPVKPIVLTPNGLLENDIVSAIEGLTVNDLIRDAFMGRWDRGTLLEKSTLEYTIVREGNPLAVQVRLEPFPIARVLQDGWSSYLAFLGLLVIGLFVFLRRPFLISAQLLFAASAALSAAGVMYGIQQQASDLLRGWVFPFEIAAHILLFFSSLSLFLHFTLIFPRRHPFLTRHPRLLLWSYVGLWLLFAAAFLVRLPSATTPSALLQLRLQSNNVTVFYLVFTIVAIVTNARQLTDEKERRQVRWAVWGTFVGIGGPAILALLPIALSLPVQSFLVLGGLFLLALPISIAIAILRENLFDIDVVINRTLIYGPLTALLAVLFGLTNSLLDFLLSGIAGEKSQINLVINTLVVVLAFNPLKDKLQEIVDKRFKAKPDPAKQLDAFSTQLRAQLTPLDVPRVIRSFLRTIVSGYEADGAQFDLDYQDIHLNNSFGTIAAAPGKQIPLLLDQVQIGTLDLGARRREREWSVQDLKTISDAANILTQEILMSTSPLK